MFTRFVNKRVFRLFEKIGVAGPPSGSGFCCGASAGSANLVKPTEHPPMGKAFQTVDALPAPDCWCGGVMARWAV